ncbi:hypothetical protein LY90DRAFT_664265 [Neocallimastix californiae]|uniref:DUF218 domain-containing protein n=1 Tax=Neocallimastix californiae TaxID=1754190 RepID=A0A1Y2FCS4_9FUNG|nr:hypothetical protein LY90DRAFT_664265 [Neocallimastix californiae]|eukprot:ORY81730.1 hypothetical protein LY90DRAFT_664265 [Neocallimastix californiae]
MGYYHDKKFKFSFKGKEKEKELPQYHENYYSRNISNWVIIKHYLRRSYIYIIFIILIIIICSYGYLPNKSNDNSLNEKFIQKLDKIIYNYYKNTTIPEIEDHLIIVAGHAISKTVTEIPTKIKDWNIKPFQTEEINTFLTHIATGILIAKYNKNSSIIFSGGQTQNIAGPLTEGQTYWYIANSMNWLNEKGIRKRATTEEFAKDSYENLLYSICRYHEFTGKYPKFITMVTYPFKHYRFNNLHRETLKYPEDKFQFVGITFNLVNSQNATSKIFPNKITDIPKDVPEFELKHSITNFQKDPHGCKGILKQKRIDRNPFNRFPSYTTSCPELKEIINYCIENKISNEIQWENL